MYYEIASSHVLLTMTESGHPYWVVSLQTKRGNLVFGQV